MRSTDRKTFWDVAKWKKGDTAYIVSGAEIRPTSIKEGNEWAFSDVVHPRNLNKLKIVKGQWRFRQEPPRLHAVDYELIIDVLNYKLIIEPFHITNAFRCPNTGECVYTNEVDEWMPESCMFPDAASARAERARVLGFVRKWLDEQDMAR